MNKFEVYEKMKNSTYFLKTVKRVSKDVLFSLYIEQHKSKDALCKELKLSSETLSSLLIHYNIVKDKDTIYKENASKQSGTRATRYKKSVQDVDIDELKHLYLELNWSYEKVRTHFGLTGHKLDRLLRENNLKKSRQQSASLVLETKYQKAGSKEAYDKHTRQVMLDNIVNSGKTVEQHFSSIGKKCSNSWKCKTIEQIEQITDKRRTSYYSDKDKVEHAKEVRLSTNIEKYGVDNAYKLAVYTGAQSEPNRLFSNILNAKHISYRSEFFLHSDTATGKGYRYDFLVNDTFIEINPWPFHNSTWSPIDTDLPLKKDYHSNKTNVAKEAGYRCIHVWDWDDKEKIVQSLLDKETIYARNCLIKQLNKSETDFFINTYHFQNTCKGQTYSYGLFYNGELIQVMTFGKPRYNKNYQYELLRLCTKFKYKVVGGAERLFKHFIKTVEPESIISYCDNSKFNGAVYQRIGMLLKDKGTPTKHWYSDKLQVHITDNFLRQRGFDQLFGKEFGCYGKGTDNDRLMIEHGFVEIYDCGQSVYTWKREH